MAQTLVTILLTRSLLTDANNPTDTLVIGTVRSSAPTAALDGFVRQFGSGRLQGVQRSNKIIRRTPLTLRGINGPAVEWLYSKMGKTVLFRSRAGERIFAQYYSIAPRPIYGAAIGSGYKYSGASNLALSNVVFDVDIELVEVDFVEVVQQ